MLSFIEKLFKAYPQLKGAILALVVTLAAKLGFHLTEAELLTVIASAIALFHGLAAIGAAAAKRDAVEDAAKRASR